MKFSLKRIREESDLTVASDTQLKTGKRRLVKKHLDFCSDDEKNLLQAIRNKAWLSYPVESSSEDEFDCEQVSSATKSSLPVGILRGCSSCEGCQKVMARWRPEAGCRPRLEDAPVFFPLEEEFQDTIKYIASITAEAEPYGICRIVPPHSWRPPCALKDDEKRRTTEFPTRVQRLDKLQVRDAKIKKEQPKRRRGRPPRNLDDLCNDSSDEDGKFGFEPGPPFTLETFEQYAKQFKDSYFGLKDRDELSDNCSNDEPSVECIEGEYWRILEHATEQLEVLYGADIETGKFGSGFPKPSLGESSNAYEQCGWNLNNSARLGGSVLSFEEEDISGVLVPWLYIGMCFSSFCWHVEDHHFYSLNYMHFGSPKVWYGVPGCAAEKLETAMKRHLPDLFEEQPDLLHKLVTQLSPSVLKGDGVPVYRAVQKPGEFVVTFPRAYHAGFNCGFNCAEAVNVAPIDWLPAGQNVVELYRQQRRKSTVSHDKLLLGAAKRYLSILRHRLSSLSPDAELIACHESFIQHGVLAAVFKERVELERIRRFKVEGLVCIKRMERSFDQTDAKECSICHYDLHLSAIGCDCTEGRRFACLEHVQELCACEKPKKHALYRFELSELFALMAALEGKHQSKNSVDKLLELFTGSEISIPDCNEKKEKVELQLTAVNSIPDCHEIKEKVELQSTLVNSKVDCSNVEKQESSSLEHKGSCLSAAGFTSTVFNHDVRSADSFGTCISKLKPVAPAESTLNGVFNPLSGFHLKDFENFELLKSINSGSPMGPAHLYSKQSSLNPLPTTRKAEENTSMEVIVLSDDEEYPSRHSIPDMSHTKNAADAGRNAAHPVTNRLFAATKTDICALPTSLNGRGFVSTFAHKFDRVPTTPNFTDKEKVINAFKELPMLLNKPIMQAVGLSSLLQVQSERSLLVSKPISVHEKKSLPTMTLQQTRSVQVSPSLYTSFKGCAKDSSSAKNWLCLGSVQAPSVDHDLSERVSLVRHPIFECQSTRRHVQSTSAIEVSAGGDRYNGIVLPQRQEVRVDLLNTGKLVLGIAWCNKDAIFPAGFRSRVLFTSFLDPCKMCFYMSEILDYGRAEPIFKVTMEDHPHEAFVHGSINKCWQMVQERVNIVIQLHHSFGKMGLPPLRPPEDVQGLDLFGFTSPHVIEAVESLDWHHQCLEYWQGKASAAGLLQTQYHTNVGSAMDLEYVIPCQNSQTSVEMSPQVGFDRVSLHNMWH